jgi:hypothetical protein
MIMTKSLCPLILLSFLIFTPTALTAPPQVIEATPDNSATNVDPGNQVTAYIPSWSDLRLDGTCLEGEGYAPDIEVKTNPADFEQRDPVLERTLQFLRTGK